jgi:hypothetical protein
MGMFYPLLSLWNDFCNSMRPMCDCLLSDSVYLRRKPSGRLQLGSRLPKSQEPEAILCLVLNLSFLSFSTAGDIEPKPRPTPSRWRASRTYDRLLREYPNTLIHTSGPFVGLPEGQMGNSEVGHLNIGAGRIVHMDITRIDLMIRNGEFFSHPVLVEAMKNARLTGAASCICSGWSRTAACTRGRSIFTRC